MHMDQKLLAQTAAMDEKYAMVALELQNVEFVGYVRIGNDGRHGTIRSHRVMVEDSRRHHTTNCHLSFTVPTD